MITCMKTSSETELWCENWLLEWTLEILLNPDPLLMDNPDLDPDSDTPDTPSMPSNDDLENNIENDDIFSNECSPGVEWFWVRVNLNQVSSVRLRVSHHDQVVHWLLLRLHQGRQTKWIIIFTQSLGQRVKAASSTLAGNILDEVVTIHRVRDIN